MELFEVRQVSQDTWSVSSEGSLLDVYPTEETARWAALTLASDRCQAGMQASVVITPPLPGYDDGEGRRSQRFSGM
jgi:hypothetical protein